MSRGIGQLAQMRANPAPQVALLLAAARFVAGGDGFEDTAVGKGDSDGDEAGVMLAAVSVVSAVTVVTAAGAACGSTLRLAYATPPAINGTTATAAATATTLTLFIDGD